jgi:hypothetical protein
MCLAAKSDAGNVERASLFSTVEPRFPGSPSEMTFFHGCASRMARWHHNYLTLKHVCDDPGRREFW